MKRVLCSWCGPRREPVIYDLIETLRLRGHHPVTCVEGHDLVARAREQAFSPVLRMKHEGLALAINEQDRTRRDELLDLPTIGPVASKPLHKIRIRHPRPYIGLRCRTAKQARHGTGHPVADSSAEQPRQRERVLIQQYPYRVPQRAGLLIGGRIGDWMTRSMARLLRCPAPQADIGSRMTYPYFMQWFGGHRSYRRQVQQ